MHDEVWLKAACSAVAWAIGETEPLILTAGELLNKLYAESFKGHEYLTRIQEEARAVIPQQCSPYC